jgi:general secretion pathway protein G
MYKIVERAKLRGRHGFTLVELLVVIVVLAVLAAIVLPRFMNSSRRSKESALRSDLKLLRNAVSLFNADTGTYPKLLTDLSSTTAPTTATAKGLDNTGTETSYSPSDWHGPYIQDLPKDPISGTDYTYSTASGTVGKVSSSATGSGLDSTAYSTW